MENYLTVEEVRQRLGLRDQNTVRAYLRSGKLKGVQPYGRRFGWRIAEDDLAKFMHSVGIEPKKSNQLKAS